MKLYRILVDSRHDWPSNGAAIALLQYSNQALKDTELYYLLKHESKHFIQQYIK